MEAVLLLLSLFGQFPYPGFSPDDQFSVWDEDSGGNVRIVFVYQNAVYQQLVLYYDSDGMGGWSVVESPASDISWNGGTYDDLVYFKAASTGGTLYNDIVDEDAMSAFDAITSSDMFCDEFPDNCGPETPTPQSALLKRVATIGAILAVGAGMASGMLMWFVFLKAKDLPSLLFR